MARPDRMPLLTTVRDLFERTDLRGTLLIANQHLLASNVPLFTALFAHGIDPADTHIIGKCYSTSDTAVRELRRLGAHVSPDSTRFDSHEAYDRTFTTAVRSFLRGVLAKNDPARFARVVLLDDGGYLLAEARRRLAGRANVIGIEQTSSGYNKLERTRMPFPVVNVARSSVKLHIESPFIADAFVRRLTPHLRKRAGEDRVLVIGAGPIGNSIARALRETHLVRKHDRITALSDLSARRWRSSLGEFDILIGCTGRRVLTRRDFRHLKPGAILASASSSDREFDGANARKASPRTHDPHRAFTVDGVTLLNGGFPLNFDGGANSVPPERIQLTRGLMLAGVLHACSRPLRPGWHQVPRETQRAIIRAFWKLQR